MSLWNVCVPGPSFDAKNIPDEGVVLCVNKALIGAKRCDYWGAFDSPNDVHLSALEHWKRLRPCIVTHRNRAAGWEKWWKQHKISKDEWPVIHTPPYEPLWFKIAAKSPFYSFFGVMSFAIQEGATHLNIIGCDMAGDKYFDHETCTLGSLKPRPKRVWDMRWGKERGMLRKLMAIFPEHGITISGVDFAKAGK